MKLGEVLKLRKAKYFKRTGSPGKYKYFYKEKPISSKEYMKEHATGIRKEADELKRMGEKDFKRKKGEYDKKKLKEALVERTIKKKKAGKKKKVDYSDAPESKLSARARKIRLDVEDGKITMKEARKKMGMKEINNNKKIEVQTLPQDIKTLTVDNVTSLIKQSVKLPFKKLRDNQSIVEQQKVQVYKQKDAKAYRRFEVMENIYQAAVDIKKFKFTTASAWAKEIVGKIKQYKY